MVLSPLRTFWEKATLIHVECGKAPRAASPSRISRHWYDVTLLADHTIGSQALLRRDLLEDVVRHKKVFFKAPAANYDDCLSASLRLVPQQAELRAVLRADFKQMEEAGMFYVAPPSFEKILERLADLENEINASNGK